MDQNSSPLTDHITIKIIVMYLGIKQEDEESKERKERERYLLSIPSSMITHQTPKSIQFVRWQKENQRRINNTYIYDIC